MQTAWDRFLRFFGRGRAFVGDGYHFGGPNSRIHWSNIIGPKKIDGVSKITVEEGGVRFGKPGHFRVRARFGSRDEARRLLGEMTVFEEDGKVFADLFVPIISREKLDDNPPCEVHVAW